MNSLDGDQKGTATDDIQTIEVPNEWDIDRERWEKVLGRLMIGTAALAIIAASIIALKETGILENDNLHSNEPIPSEAKPTEIKTEPK